jgi:hypothetical protein
MDELVQAMARWLDAAAQEQADNGVARVSALEEARHRLAACLRPTPLGPLVRLRKRAR